MPFNMRQIRYTVAAAQHGSLNRAARALGTDESTISRAIIRLERVIGANLFVRSRAGVTLTAAGVKFISEARSILARADSLVAWTRAAGEGRAGTLMIGHYSPISAGNFRATLLDWHDTNPDVDVGGVEAERETLLAGLDAGVIDLAIMSGEASYEGIYRASFWSERILVALPASHPLAAREDIQWNDLRNETFLLTCADPGPEIRDLLLSCLLAEGTQPTIKMQDVSREAILSVLGGWSAVSITYEGASGIRYPDVVLRELNGPCGRATTGYSGFWREGNRNPTLRRFLTYVRRRYSLSFDF